MCAPSQRLSTTDGFNRAAASEGFRKPAREAAGQDFASRRCIRRPANAAHDGIIRRRAGRTNGVCIDDERMLRLTFSNRFEALLDGLVESLGEPPASPFEPQHVVVPSMAVRRRIELALADRLGICANVEFSFLGAWLWRQIGRLVDVADDSPFAPEV